MSEPHTRPAASRTAMITSVMRALHTRYERPTLMEDAWGDVLVTDEERRAMAGMILYELPAAKREAILAKTDAREILHQAWKETGLYGGVIMRSRFTEDHVKAAVRRGVKQYVLIGAGMDSFGMRRPAWAEGLDVFEIDHAASQALKWERIAASGAAIPETLHFVEADLRHESLPTALARSRYRFEEEAIFSWLGVTIYLTHEANLATLRSIAEFAAPDSRLIFTYAEQRLLDSPPPLMKQAMIVAAKLGEPWLSGFDSETLGEELEGMGLLLEEDVGPEEQTVMYCKGRADGLRPGRAGRIARIRVVGTL